MQTTAPPQEPAETMTETGNGDHDSSQLCPGCMEINEARAHFCTRCGAPLSSYAATAPFERIMAEGHAYRSAVENPRSPMILADIWVIFGPMTLGSAALLLGRGPADPLQTGLAVFILAVSVLMLWRTTAGYFAARRRLAEASVSAGEEN